MVANADGGCNVLAGCAEPEVDPTMATQKSNAMAGSARMSPDAPIEDNWSPEDNRSATRPLLGLAASNKAAPAFGYHPKDQRKVATECGRLRTRLALNNFDTGK